MEGLKSAALYQNEERTITLIDVPSSISLGQLLPGQPLKQILLSTPPLERPYPSTEPRSDAARAKVLSRMSHTENTYDSSDFIRNGLLEIREQHRGNWCLARHLSPLVPARRNSKRKIDDFVHSEHSSGALEEPDLSILDLGDKLVGDCLQIYTLSEQITTVSVQNHDSKPSILGTTLPLATYNIPGRAAAVVGTINHETATHFSELLPKLYSQPSFSARQNQFDFILLDPPWNNRSATRSNRYKTMRKEDPVAVISDMLGNYIAPGGYVACWITNKSVVRSTALASFFDAWNVELLEEWIWVKITIKGEPVYDIDGLWRKPYEVLLLGKKRDPHAWSKSAAQEKDVVSVQRRLIFGVPDLHSRKPCLRELIEPLMLDQTKYRALEVFARNMTAGWLAWGDEALKFNWSGHWAKIEVPVAAPSDEKSQPQGSPETKTDDA
jgi:N6-adenosine-specific RNA methylase IME4